MAEVTPPVPPSAPPTAAPAAPPTASVPNPPPALLELPLGARLDAVIALLDPQGRVAVDTAIGRLLLETRFPLPKDGPLQLQLTAKGALPQLQIVSVRGLAPQAAARALGLGSTPAAATSARAGGGPAEAGPQAGLPTGQPAVNLTVGATLVATFLRAGPPTASPGALPTAGHPGPATAGRGGAPATAPTAGPPLGGLKPAGQPAAAPPTAATGPATAAGGGRAATPFQPTAVQPGLARPTAPGAGPATPSAPATQATSAAASGPAAPPPGTLYSVRILDFQPAAGAAAPALKPGGALSLAPGSTLTGVVTGQARPSGHPIVETPAGTLIVPTRTPPPVGSAVTFEVLSQSAPAAPQHPTGHAGAADWLTQSWPALRDAVAALEDASPAAAQQLLQAVMPRPGATLGANILFFLMALSGGDISGWIGDGPARALQRLRPALFERLRDDFGRIVRTADERGPGEWRTVPIPFFNGAEIEQMRLYLRQSGEEREDEDKARQGTRFVVDVSLSRIGRLQLDGLVYQKEKHMDLIVRTENRLPGRIETDIRDIFQEAGETTGLKGGIGFQAAPPNFVEVAQPERPGRPVGLIV